LGSGITIYHQNEKEFTIPSVLRYISGYWKGRSKILFTSNQGSGLYSCCQVATLSRDVAV